MMNTGSHVCFIGGGRSIRFEFEFYFPELFIGFDDLLLQTGFKCFYFFGYFRITHPEDLGRKDACVTCRVKPYCCYRYTRRHLQNGKDGIPTINRDRGLDRYPDYRDRSEGGNNTWQVGSATGTWLAGFWIAARTL